MIVFNDYNIVLNKVNKKPAEAGFMQSND